MVLWQYFHLYLTHEVVLGTVAILDFINWCPSSGTDYFQCEWMIINCEVLSHDQMVVPCLPFLITWPNGSALCHLWSTQTCPLPWMVETPTILVIFHFYQMSKMFDVTPFLFDESIWFIPSILWLSPELQFRLLRHAVVKYTWGLFTSWNAICRVSPNICTLYLTGSQCFSSLTSGFVAYCCYQV